MGAGIFGESPHGMPPRALGTAGEDVRSSPATAEAIGPGGSTVRAGSIAGSDAAGAVTTGAGVGARLADGVGRRRRLHQLAAAAEAKLVVVLVFFAAAVAGDQNDPR